MKKIVIMAFAFVALLFAGCKTTEIPSVDDVAKVSNKVGASAGFIANQFDVDQNVREQIKIIAVRFSQLVPDKNTTFKELWMPEVKALVAKLVEEEKMTELQADLVVAGFKPICSGLDYLFTKKYPKLKEYSDLSNVAVSSFVEGFLRTFKPVDEFVAASPEQLEYDVEAYDFIKLDIQ